MWKFEHYTNYRDEITHQDILIKSYIEKEEIEGQAEICAWCGDNRWPECCNYCVPFKEEHAK